MQSEPMKTKTKQKGHQTDNDLAAKTLFLDMVKCATDQSLPPAIVLVACIGGIAELIRQNRKPADWDDALDVVVGHVRSILHQHRPS